jgi:ABC-type sugar transport system ATPase subunit
MIHATSAGTAAMHTSTPSAISATNLCKRYRATVAVDKVSFQVPSGVVCGVIGPNGAGKTTLMRMLLGLVRPTSGQAREADVLFAEASAPDAAALNRAAHAAGITLVELSEVQPGLEAIFFQLTQRRQPSAVSMKHGS